MVSSLLSRAWRNVPATESNEAPFAAYRHRPVEFFQDVLGWSPWGKEDSPTGSPGQREWLESLTRHGRTLVSTCHGPGKTRLAGGIVLWFMSTRRNAIVSTVAPTWPQVVKLTWAQIRAEHAEAKRRIPGPVPLTHAWELGPKWTASGFSTDDQTRAQGIHAHTSSAGEEGELLVILEEASGIEPYIYRAMEGWLTKGKCYVLQIGNPKFCEGDFYESSKDPSYEVFYCSAYDAPRAIISQQWIDDMRRRHPEDDDYFWITQVLGQFAERAGDKGLYPRWILEASKSVAPVNYEDRHVGINVARFGIDRNVATLTVGMAVKAIEHWGGMDGPDSAKKIVDLLTAWGIPKHEAWRAHIDVGGNPGVFDSLRAMGWSCDPVDFGSSPRGDYKWLVGDFKFANRKAELFRAGAELLRQKRAGIPERFRQTWEQLGWIRGDYRALTDVFFIEPKKELKAEVGESPDFADSWAISLARSHFHGKLDEEFLV